MRLFHALLVLLALTNGCHAGTIRRGAILQVRADSVWFEDRATLAQWQARKQVATQAGDAAAFATYQQGLLQARAAWQFTKPIKVKIRCVAPKAHLVDVEMLTEGRLQRSRWMLDADAIVQ